MLCPAREGAVTVSLILQKCGPGRAELQADDFAILATTKRRFSWNYRH